MSRSNQPAVGYWLGRVYLNIINLASIVARLPCLLAAAGVWSHHNNTKVI
jgi:hypothetical protein